MRLLKAGVLNVENCVFDFCKSLITFPQGLVFMFKELENHFVMKAHILN